MGWCSGTEVFDPIAGALLGSLEGKQINVESVLKVVIEACENGDWDCQQDSKYWDHPIVQKLMRELHPDWEWE
jgi:hypothetical protein